MGYQGIQAGFVKPKSPLDWAEGVAFYRGDARNLALSMQGRPKFLHDEPAGMKKPIVFDDLGEELFSGSLDDLDGILDVFFPKKPGSTIVTPATNVISAINPFTQMKKYLIIAGVVGASAIVVYAIWRRRQQQ